VIALLNDIAVGDDDDAGIILAVLIGVLLGIFIGMIMLLVVHCIKHR